MILRAEDAETDPDFQGSYMDKTQEADYEAYERDLSDCDYEAGVQAEEGDEEEQAYWDAVYTTTKSKSALSTTVPTTRCIEFAHFGQLK